MVRQLTTPQVNTERRACFTVCTGNRGTRRSCPMADADTCKAAKSRAKRQSNATLDGNLLCLTGQDTSCTFRRAVQLHDRNNL
jgi:hypothetical protein